MKPIIQTTIPAPVETDTPASNANTINNNGGGPDTGSSSPLFGVLGGSDSNSLFDPIKTSVSDGGASNFRQSGARTGSDQAKSRPQPPPSPVHPSTNIPASSPSSSSSSTSSFQNPAQLHVFSRPSPLDRQPAVFQPNEQRTPQSPKPQTFLGRTPSRGGVQFPTGANSIPTLAQNILASFTKEQLEALRHQLTVSLFPQQQQQQTNSDRNNNNNNRFATNFDNTISSGISKQEEFRFDNQFNKNFGPIQTQQPPRTTTTATSTSTTTTTTRKPMNFRLKSRERRIRNRNRARNPNAIRLTTKKPSTEAPQKPDLFNPFPGGENSNNNLQISPNFAAHPQAVTKFSQEKLNAFANLLAVVNDDMETSTEKSNIASVSLGEGGFMSHDDENVETVTSHKVWMDVLMNTF